MPLAPDIAARALFPMAAHPATAAGPCPVAAYVYITAAVPGPFAFYPNGAGIRPHRSFVNRLSRTFINIIAGA